MVKTRANAYFYEWYFYCQFTISVILLKAFKKGELNELKLFLFIFLDINLNIHALYGFPLCCLIRFK